MNKQGNQLSLMLSLNEFANSPKSSVYDEVSANSFNRLSSLEAKQSSWKFRVGGDAENEIRFVIASARFAEQLNVLKEEVQSHRSLCVVTCKCYRTGNDKSSHKKLYEREKERRLENKRHQLHFACCITDLLSAVGHGNCSRTTTCAFVTCDHVRLE